MGFDIASAQTSIEPGNFRRDFQKACGLDIVVLCPAIPDPGMQGKCLVETQLPLTEACSSLLDQFKPARPAGGGGKRFHPSQYAVMSHSDTNVPAFSDSI